MKHKSFSYEDFELKKYKEVSFLGSQFTRCIFMNCDFSEALLTGVIFRNCEFYTCDFDSAYIFRSQLKDCQLIDCSFTEKTLMSTVDFAGTEFVDVTYNGTQITRPPVIIDGIEYPIVALDNGYMQAGCEYNTYEWFYNAGTRTAAGLEGLRSARFWLKNKAWIFEMLKARGLYVRRDG